MAGVRIVDCLLIFNTNVAEVDVLLTTIELVQLGARSIPALSSSQTPLLLAVWNTTVLPQLIVHGPVQNILLILIDVTVSIDVLGEATLAKVKVELAITDAMACLPGALNVGAVIIEPFV